MNRSSMFFLLGGADLEMQTIRSILVSENIPYADYGLRWDNAFLSRYQKELDEHSDTWIYGVELQEDIPLPSNYKAIDHHNQNTGLPSALEQVVNLLQLPMTRYWELVAANDKAYIPGMMEKGASEEEITTIRLADRKAQGVSEEEEELAVKAISENRKEVNGLTVIYANSSRFSPICDRLFPYKRLLIYTDSEWMYYGEGAVLVRNLFQSEYRNGGLFYGGGLEGYVGIKQHFYGKEEVLKMITQIINLKV